METIKINSIEMDRALFLFTAFRQRGRYVWIMSQTNGTVSIDMDVVDYSEHLLVMFGQHATAEDLHRWPYGPTADELGTWVTQTFGFHPSVRRHADTAVLPIVK